MIYRHNTHIHTHIIYLYIHLVCPSRVDDDHDTFAIYIHTYIHTHKYIDVNIYFFFLHIWSSTVYVCWLSMGVVLPVCEFIGEEEDILGENSYTATFAFH